MRPSLTLLVVGTAVLAIVAALTPAHAAGKEDDCQDERQDESQRPSDDCVPIGRWNFSMAVGAGVRTNPLVDGKNIPLVLIPQLSYYGKRFFIDNLDFGVTLTEHGAHTFNLIATPGYDRVFFFRSDLQNFFVGFPNSPSVAVAVTAQTPGATRVPPPAPRITYLAGPEWTFTSGQVSGQLDLLRDATGQNSGDEIRGAVRVPLLQAEGMTKGTVSANVGFTWKSAATVNYYYRVPLLYAGRAAFDPFIRLGYTLPLSDKWRCNAFAEYERLGKGIADSPIVAEHGVATVFVGAVYAF